jgi:hypothetical protein
VLQLFDNVVGCSDEPEMKNLNDVRVGTVGFEPEFFLRDDGIEQGPDLPARLARPCSRCQYVAEGCRLDGALSGNHQGEHALRHIGGEEVAVLLGFNEDICAGGSVR